PLGIALKVEDGSAQPRAVAVVALLRLLGLDPGPTPWDQPERWHYRGLQVGYLKAHLELTWV
ncbi:asparaginase, partial [Thermus scotoductus]